MKTLMTAAAALVLAAAISTRPAAQEGRLASAEGHTKSLQCVACHGPSGITPNPMFPHLAGQNATYLEIQLEKFKSGERYHALMTPVAQSLSRQDIIDLSIYYSSIGPLAGASNIGTEP
jgi:cytochrome c553